VLEVRIHGRGGQGNVVAAYLLATVAINEGRFAQAFPAFGAERRGAPVTAFVRIAKDAFRRRSQVREPAFLIVQDQSLLHVEGVTDGLPADGGILVNSSLSSRVLSQQLGREAIAMPATNLAKELLGRPVPNTALLAGFLALTHMLPLESLVSSLAERFSGEMLERNTRLIEEAAKQVPPGHWKEVAHAHGA